MRYKTAALCSLVLCLSGCYSVNGLRTQTDPSTGQSDVRVFASNITLNGQVRVNRVAFKQVGSMRQASLRITNILPAEASFQYKINWLDASGTEINPEGAIWKPIILSGLESKAVQSLAPDQRGIDVVVYIKP